MKLRPALSQNAFSRADLMALLGSLTLLALLALSVAGTTRSGTQAMLCRNNLQRLANAWLMYSGDNKQLVANVHGAEALSPQPARTTSWATGWLDWGSSPHNTNTAYLQTPPFARYVGQDLSAFKCPSDIYLSPLQRKLGWIRRVRTYVMNGYVGPGNAETGPIDLTYAHFLKLEDMRIPSQTFVFAEEHPDSVNDPLLFISPTGTQFLDLPASFHDRGANFTFGDGHIEGHHWTSGFSSQPVRYNFNLFTPKPKDPDMLWIGARASQKR